MKKKGLLLAVCLLTGFVVFAKPGDRMYVRVQDCKVKSGTGFFASTVGNLYYGDEIRVVTEKGKWVEVSGVSLVSKKEVKGWVPSDVLTKKKIVAQNGKAGVSASAEELALAGKGFSAEIEGAFSKGAKAQAYAVVDRVESIKVLEAQLRDFIQEGALNEGGE